MLRTVAVLLVALAACIPSVSSAIINADLKTGSTGEQVKELQRFLIAEKFLSNEASGNFYIQTQKAVKVYQRSIHVSASGYVGSRTRAAINKMLALVAPAQESVAHADTGSSSPSQTASAFEFDQHWRDAVVNLFCTDRYSGAVSSGSGVVIDPRGVILTNAHVAADFLFTKWPQPSLEDCVVRVGSPAHPAYTAELLYMPEGFVRDTLTSTSTSDDTITYGKDDFAILLITGPSSAWVTVPDTFPYLKLADSPPPVSAPVYLLGYASEFTSIETLQRNLYQLASPATVYRHRAIGSGTALDSVAFNGNIAGQHGSSGGAVISNGGAVAGIMTFFDKNQGTTTSEKILNAITVDYISRDFKSGTGVDLQGFLATPDLKALAKKYAEEQMPQLQKLVAKYWKSKGYDIPGYSE